MVKFLTGEDSLSAITLWRTPGSFNPIWPYPTGGTVFCLTHKDTFAKLKFDELVKSLILFARQAILGFMTRLAKLQELGLTPSNSLKFLAPDAS